MEFKPAIEVCFRKYAVFSGRAMRSEFWWFSLFLIVGSLLTSFVDAAVFGGSSSVLNLLFSLGTFLPSLGVAVRRLHDTDRSGWWWWLWLIPIIGWILLIVWYASEGTRGHNRFGSDPLADNGTSSGPPAAPYFEDSSDYSKSSIPRVSKD